VKSNRNKYRNPATDKKRPDIARRDVHGSVVGGVTRQVVSPPNMEFQLKHASAYLCRRNLRLETRPSLAGLPTCPIMPTTQVPLAPLSWDRRFLQTSGSTTIELCSCIKLSKIFLACNDLARARRNIEI
jgi:hypothetical protein